MALSINLESQAGSGGSWEICNGLEPSISSILMVTLCTGAVPVFLPRTCWLQGKNHDMQNQKRKITQKLCRELVNFETYFQTDNVRHLAGT